MKDQEFLIWLHTRLEKQQNRFAATESNEPKMVDYMHKLRSIILEMDPMQSSIGRSFNSKEEMLDYLSSNTKTQKCEGFFKCLRKCLKI